MTEEIREEAAGASPAAATPPASTPPAAEPPSKSLAEAGVSDPSPPPVENAAPKADDYKWPDDWREKLAAGDEKLKGLLSRYTTPDAMAKAFKEQRDALAKKPTKEDVAELPENATPEQIAEYRKAKGIPDKPEDYEFEVPEGKELSDSEYDILMDFAKEMHGSNMPADTVKKISSWFLQYETAMAQKHNEAAFKARTETEEKLRAEWAGDYKANINLMSNVLQEHLGTNTGDFLSTRLMDGTKLGDNEGFIRLMADLSRKVGGSAAELYTSDVATTAKSLEDRKAELLAMSTAADPAVRKKYWNDPKIQDEMNRIQTALIRRSS